MNVDICASYAKADGTPQIIQTSATKLPLSMLMHTTREQSEGEDHSIGFDFAGNYNDTVRAFLPGNLIDFQLIFLSSMNFQRKQSFS